MNLQKAVKLSKYLLKEIDSIEHMKSELAERMIKDIDTQSKLLNQSRSTSQLSNYNSTMNLNSVGSVQRESFSETMMLKLLSKQKGVREVRRNTTGR